jgi:hypothetical protein
MRGTDNHLSFLGRRQAEIAVEIEASHLKIDPNLQELAPGLRVGAERFEQGWHVEAIEDAGTDPSLGFQYLLC